MKLGIAFAADMNTGVEEQQVELVDHEMKHAVAVGQKVEVREHGEPVVEQHGVHAAAAAGVKIGVVEQHGELLAALVSQVEYLF